MWNFAIIKSRIVCVRFFGVIRRRTQDIVPHTPVIVNGFSFLLFGAGGPYGAGQWIASGEYPPFYGRFFQVSCVFWLETIPLLVMVCCPQIHGFIWRQRQKILCKRPFSFAAYPCGAVSNSFFIKMQPISCRQFISYCGTCPSQHGLHLFSPCFHK